MLEGKIIPAISILLILKFFGIQAALKVIVEDILCKSYDEEYLTEPDIYFDENYDAFVNFSIIKQIPPDAQAHCVLLGASMGEYVIHTGIEAQMDICEAMEEPIILGPIFKLFGFSGTECPSPVGVYGGQSIRVPSDGLPDYFQPNQYLTIAEILYGERKILEIHVYTKVQ